VVEDDLQHFKPELAGLLKKYSNGNSVVAAEVKRDNDLKTFLLKCSMVLLSNKNININDSTKGLRRRLYPFTFGSDITESFDRYKNGVPLLKNELPVIFNLLRYRMPRVIKTGVLHNSLMNKDIDRITRGSAVDRYMRFIKHAEGKQLPMVDVLSYITASMSDIYGSSSRQADRVSIELIRDKATQLGFTVDYSRGIIMDAKLKTPKDAK